MLEGFRGEVEEHGGFRRPVHPWMGLPRPADRDKSRSATWWKKVADEGCGRSPGVSKIRAKISGSTARTIQTYRSSGAVRQALLDHDSRVRVGRAGNFL